MSGTVTTNILGVIAMSFMSGALFLSMRNLPLPPNMIHLDFNREIPTFWEVLCETDIYRLQEKWMLRSAWYAWKFDTQWFPGFVAESILFPAERWIWAIYRVFAGIVNLIHALVLFVACLVGFDVTVPVERLL